MEIKDVVKTEEIEPAMPPQNPGTLIFSSSTTYTGSTVIETGPDGTPVLRTRPPSQNR